MAIKEQQARVLAWEGCLNARDLGGYRTRDGKETRWGAVVRSDTPSQLTATGQAALLAYGIRSIVDLRKPDELAQHPNPFAAPGSHGITYTNISLVDPARSPAAEFTTLANDYKGMLDRFQSTVGRIAIAIAEAPSGAVLIHCMAGKDRTGIICALLLALAGVPNDTIAADYALTAECLRPFDEHWLENGPGERADRERDLVRASARADVMLEVLQYLHERHGGVEAYLLEAGVSAADIQRLRERLLE
ncbi:MAG TPA: tyrosine-protein phosphatase [Chloroflexota bacterium]|nr:tyrosine-protein phosphatase [Chloroflexota bacterium]